MFNKGIKNILGIFITALVLTACSEGEGDNFVSLKSVSVTRDDVSVTELDLSENQEPIDITWEVDFKAPAGLYGITVSAFEGVGQTTKLFYQNCGSKTGVLMNCGKSGEAQCSFNGTAASCRIGGSSDRANLSSQYTHIKFEACITDDLFEDSCDVEWVKLPINMNSGGDDQGGDDQGGDDQGGDDQGGDDQGGDDQGDGEPLNAIVPPSLGLEKFNLPSNLVPLQSF